MKKINENTKVTLTLAQLKKLVKEGVRRQPEEGFWTKSDKFDDIFKKMVISKLGKKYWNEISVDYVSDYYSITDDCEFYPDDVDSDADDFDSENCGYAVIRIFCGDDGGQEYEDVYPIARVALKQAGLRPVDENIAEDTNGFDFLFKE